MEKEVDEKITDDNVINLTIILGNGFDLNLGLKTAYKNFIDIYKKEKADDAQEIKMMKELLSEDDFDWCDLEEKLGEYTDSYNDAIKFSNAHNDMGEKLQKYLLNEENRFNKYLEKDNSICVKFVDGITTLINNYVGEIYKDTNWQDKKICINFVTFNYTTIIDNVVNKIKNNKELKEKMYKNYCFGKITHCHGTLYSRMCFGVDNVDQIKNKKLFSGVSIRYIQELIKPEYNDVIKSGFDVLAKKVIHKSNIIIAYGCSFGKTDYTWIREISSWLGYVIDVYGEGHNIRYDIIKNNNNIRKFIIFSHEKPKNNFFGTSAMIHEDSIKEKFTYRDDAWIDIVYGNMFVAIEKCVKD